MRIRPFILAFAFTCSSLIAFAQKGELSNAKSNYEKFTAFKQLNLKKAVNVTDLKTAKESIDKAVVHEKTMNDPSAWAYKALIYVELAMLDTIPTTSRPLAVEAANAVKKGTELDKAGANKSNLETASGYLAQYELNNGVRAYQSKKFDDAYSAFTQALAYRPGDTTLTYYSGLSAINMKDNKKAIEQYESLTKTNFSANKQVYFELSRMYAKELDTVAAIRIASEGAKKFNDPALATQEIELSLMSGKQKEMISQISEQIQKDPKNKLYPFYLGIAYSAAKDFQKAEDAYKKALEIDPNYLEANLNISGLILNRGIEIYNKANKLPASKQKEYDEMKKTAKAEFDRAFPYLHKAAELDPKSRMALENLKTYYIATQNNAKIEEISQKLKSL